MTEPIKPSEVVSRKRAILPGLVLGAFNDLIAANFDGRSARVMQRDVVRAILDRMKPDDDRLREQDVYDRKWLDVEDVYRKAGWKVEYDKPGYNENYPASFVFSKKSD